MEKQFNWRKLLSSCVVLVLAPNLLAFCPTSPCRYEGAPSRLLNAPEQDEHVEENEANNKDDFSLNSVFSRVSRLANRGVSDVASVAGTAKSIVGATGSGVKTVAGAATSGVSKLAKKGTTDVVSVASATGSGVQSIAGAAASGASGVARKAASDVKTVASAAGSGVQTVASAAGSGISRLTETGGTGVNVAASGLSRLAKEGSSGVQYVANAAGSNLSQVTERGSLDVSKVIQWLDAQGRGTAKVAKDTAVAADAQAKAVAKELLRQTTSADYSISDVLLLLKVLVVLGASFGPLAKLLPVTVLLNMLNVSLEARLGGKILEVLAESLDERFLAAFTAEELGDLVKRSLRGAILSFTRKETYEQGDIQRAVTNGGNVDENDATKSPSELSILELSVGPEFAQWDEAFRESQLGMEIAIVESLDEGRNRAEGGQMRPKVLDQEAARELEEWDGKFRDSLM